MKIVMVIGLTVVGVYYEETIPDYLADPRFILIPTELEHVVDYGWRLVDGTWLEPLPAEAAVSRLEAYQAKIILHQYGLLNNVEALLTHPDTPAKIRLMWENSVPLSRDNPMVLLIASQLSISTELLDELFAEGALITPDVL